MRLPEIYTILQREHHISPGDFPNVTKMQVQEQEVMSHSLFLHNHLCFGPSPQFTESAEPCTTL